MNSPLGEGQKNEIVNRIQRSPTIVAKQKSFCFHGSSGIEKLNGNNQQFIVDFRSPFYCSFFFVIIFYSVFLEKKSGQKV